MRHRRPRGPVDTIIDFAAIERFGVEMAGNADASDAGVPIAQVFALDDVQNAYRTLKKRI